VGKENTWKTLDTDGKIVFKWIFMKQNGKAWLD
jgi:hypothetical protein